MSMYNEADARAILDKVLKLSKADECDGDARGHGRAATSASRATPSRPAASSATPRSASSAASASASGTATINEFDDDVARARRAARRGTRAAGAREPGVHAGAGASRPTRPSPTFNASVAAITPEYRARVATDSIDALPRARRLVAAGFLARRPELRCHRQQQGQLRLPAGDQPRLHLHRAHRRRARLGLGRPQRRRCRPSSTSPRRSASRWRRPAARSRRRRSSPASTR